MSPAAPVSECAPARVAATATWVAAARPDETARLWDRATLAPLADLKLPSPCRDLLSWDGAILCAVGARGVLVLDPAGAQPALTHAPHAIEQIAATGYGALLLGYDDGTIGKLAPDAGLQPDADAFAAAWRPGRHLRDLAMDAGGDAVASVHENGTLWLGRWPRTPMLVGMHLPANAPPPDEILFLGSEGLLVRAGATLLQYALADPALPVPLPSATHGIGARDPHLVALAGPVAVVRGSAGPPLLLDAGDLRGWPLAGTVVGLAPAPGEAAWAVRCDGSLTLEPVPPSAPFAIDPALSRALDDRGAGDAATGWMEAATRALGGAPDRALLLAAQAAEQADPDPSPPSSPRRLLTLAQAHLDAARIRGAWVYPLSSAEVYITEAEAMAPADPDVAAARAELLALRAEQRRARLKLALLGTLLGTGVGGAWAWLQTRHDAQTAAVVANYNPFRQDSPSDPQRTPFSEHPLVEDVLLGLAHNCVVVEAAPFSGKTALLHHLAWRLERDGLEGMPVRVAWVSLRGVAERDFWTALGHALARAATDFPGHTGLTEETPLDRFAVETFLDSLWAWEEDVDYAPRRVVLVLDDLDVLGEFTDESQRFRGLVQILPAARLTVLGATSSLRHGWAEGQLDSPWFNIFQVRDLAPLQREEVARYLERRLQPPFSFHPEVPLLLHAASRGRALHLWHLAYATVEEALLDRTTRITPAHVSAAIDAIQHLIAGEGSLGRDGEATYAEALGQIARLRLRRDVLLNRVATQRGF